MKPQVIICSRVEHKNITSSGDFEVLNTESATLVQEMNDSDPGISTVQRLDIIADIDVDKASELQRIPQLWRLTNSEGKVFEWGTLEYKTRCKTCIRNGENTRMSFERKSPNTDL